LLDVSGAASGDVRVQGNNITLKDGSIILAATFGNRDGGEIFMRSQQLNVAGNSALGAFAPSAGISGDVTLEVGNLTVQNAIIGSFADKQAATGEIAIRATNTVQLIGTLFSGPFSQLPGGLFAVTGGSRQGGDAIIQTRQLLVSDGALLAVSNGGEGQGGTIQIGASDIKLIGQTNPSFFHSGIFATTFGIGRGGNINIKTQRLKLENGANVLTGTRRGPGGNIVINASDFIEIIGTEDPKIITDVSANTLGSRSAGNVQIETGQLIVRDGGQVTAAALQESEGAAGDIEIEARTISLDNQGAITTNTRSGAFGNIDLQSQFLLLRRGSKITTDATQGTATGGNIDIDTQFLIAVPNENSDITANAIRGSGGNVQIRTQGIFGIEFREEPTPLSDITASSEFGVAGNVQIDAPDTDPSRRVVNLPTLTVEPEVVQACTPSDTQAQSEFIITGRGGLPPSASEAIGTDAIGIDWVTLNPQQPTESESRDTSVAPYAQENAQSPNEERIIEAQGMVVSSDGKVILTAQAPTVTPHIPWLPTSYCEGS
jgi:large exoprotein involved in heme utilization and adhesion